MLQYDKLEEYVGTGSPIQLEQVFFFEGKERFGRLDRVIGTIITLILLRLPSTIVKLLVVPSACCKLRAAPEKIYAGVPIVVTHSI